MRTASPSQERNNPIKIVFDSSSDIRHADDVDSAYASLKIITAAHEYIDDDCLAKKLYEESHPEAAEKGGLLVGFEK